ncbi:phosphatidylinositol-specific phospholipase C/glycerophosphodiester phosphodiesterase family protein [Allorhodopirellula solitaria]|uniref:Altered inheritance of mitochondria protein 6 n=1 Tax=Allorhodopirellula solitaria TaxID=2527987 RepID=A0A5C5WZS4_9BACT|nr:phosphatidylinositol-specific phospholipase C/glycerophosphodiester phosphodiesterase family protein [Allorhodopirellula solitaria]TWT56166.1 hypothetical protein CA85_45080 [Allorhodopirellula solitaria]
MYVPFLFLAAVVAVNLPVANPIADEIKPHRQAHAHNDYLHHRPLLDALDQGFTSVEADVFLVDGELLVAHTFLELKPNRTLRALYLDPLRARIQDHGGFVYSDQTPITLLIDFKSDGEATFAALNQLLSEYRDVFSWTEDGTEHPGAVVAIVSGNRPIATMKAASPRFAGIDGRLGDLNSDLPPEVMPLISDNWKNHFEWRGKGEFPATERIALERIVDQAHTQNRRVRFWGTPDNPAMWAALRDAGVDLINTDDLAGLSDFLASALGNQ